MHRALATAIAIGLVTAPIAPLTPRAHAGTPWSRGVSDAAQKKALALFQEGNVYFEQAKYTEALARYELALAVWDHPNIRFNMAVCMIHIRQPLVAWAHLQQAVRFGDAPLGKRLFAEAQTYQAALEASLGDLRLRTRQPEVKIFVDGQLVLTGAGQHAMKVLAGKHQVVASRPGYLTDSRALDLPAGQPTELELTLLPERVSVERENYERRWAWWAPWAVAGGGVALGAIGAALYASARSDIRAYDDELAALCPLGCAPSDIPDSLASRARAARRKSGVGIGLLVGAGVAAVASGAMAVLNRPRRIDDRRVTPELTVGPGYVGAGVTLAWP